MAIRNCVLNDRVWGITYDVVSELDDITDFYNLSAGTQSTISDGPFGTPAIRQLLDLDNEQPRAKLALTPSSPFNTGAISRFIRVSDLTKWKESYETWWRVTFSSSGYYDQSPKLGSGSADADNANGYKDFGKLTEGQWFQAQWFNMPARSGAPSWSSNSTNLEQFWIQTKGTGSSDAGLFVDYSQLTANARHERAVIIFSFDDSNDTDLTIAEPILATAGYKGTTYTIPRLIGQSGFLSLAQLTTLRDKGWTVGSHGVEVDSGSFANLALMSESEQDTELAAVKAYMIANGFPDWQHYSYPEGKYNNFTETALNNAGFLTSRTTDAETYALMKGFPLYFTTGYGTSNANIGGAVDLTDKVDQAITRGGVVEFFTHLLTPSGSGNQTSTADFQTLVTYVKAKELAGELIVVTKKELYEESQGGGLALTGPLTFDLTFDLTNDLTG